MREIGLVLLGAALAVAAGNLIPAVKAVNFADPNMKGVWQPDSYHAAARSGVMTAGGSTPGFGSLVEPAALTSVPDQSAWTLSFDEQKGGAFRGESVSPTGEKVPVLGAFKSDGKRFVYSTPYGSGSGEVDEGRMEWCFTDHVPNFTSAECTVYSKVR